MTEMMPGTAALTLQSESIATNADFGSMLFISNQKANVFTTNRSTQTKSETTRTMLMPMLRDSIALAIGSISEVQAIFTNSQDRVFYVWCVVTDSDPSIRRRIYAKEKELIDSFSDFEFDFSIVAGRGRESFEVINDPEARLIYHK